MTDNRQQSEWLDDPRVTLLRFADYDAGLREIVDLLGGASASLVIPQINAAEGPVSELSMGEAEAVWAYYAADLQL